MSRSFENWWLSADNQMRSYIQEGAARLIWNAALEDDSAVKDGVGYKIPVGTVIFHDNMVYRWPSCGNSSPVDKDTLFLVHLQGDNMEFVAKGFGLVTGDAKDYGNGSILIKKAHWREAIINGRAV